MAMPPIWLQTLFGLAAGVMAGLISPQYVVYWLWLGDGFLLALRLLALPLIIVSIIGGIASLGATTQLGRLGLRVTVLYVTTTMMAIPVGLLLSGFLQPGAGMDATLLLPTVDSNGAVSFVRAWFDHSIIRYLTAINPMTVIVASLIAGALVLSLGSRGARLAEGVEQAARVIYAITGVIIRFAPLGVFALTSKVAADFGVDVLLPVGKLVLCVYLACFLHMAISLNGLLYVLTKLPVRPFWRGIFEAQLVAFSTSTAAGTLPVTTACVRHNLGVSDRIAKFVLPIGTTVNMDGTAIYQVVAALFVAQMYDLPLQLMDYLVLASTALLASIGAASIPGGGLVVLSMVMSSIGLPLEGIGLIAGIDRILDMVRTATNVTSDAVITTILASGEGELNREIYEREPE